MLTLKSKWNTPVFLICYCYTLSF